MGLTVMASDYKYECSGTFWASGSSRLARFFQLHRIDLKKDKVFASWFSLHSTETVNFEISQLFKETLFWGINNLTFFCQTMAIMCFFHFVSLCMCTSILKHNNEIARVFKIVYRSRFSIKPQIFTQISTLTCKHLWKELLMLQSILPYKQNAK